MNYFGAALTLFVLLHIGVSATGLRTRLVQTVGEGPYRGLFSLLSLALLVWLVFGFHDMRENPFDPLNDVMWQPPAWAKWPAYALILLGFVLGVAGLLTPGPTLTGFEKTVENPDAARGVLRITRNPFLWGVALWAAGHLLVNGERFAVMLFGALGAMVLFGARSIDRKAAARNPEAWARYAEATSNAPFAAIAQGRNQLKLGEMWWRLLLGVAVFFLVGLLHRQFVGVAAIF